MRPALTNALTNAIREALNYSSTNLEPEPIANYVARLNGDDQYWQLTKPIALEVGDEILFFTAKEAGLTSSKQWFASGSRLRINVQANNKIEEIGGDLYIDGEFVTNYTTDFPIDGLEHFLSYTITSADRFLSILGASDGGFERLKGYVRALVVKRGGVVINEIPLTDKDQGATQLPTVGDVSATMIGYTGDEWEEV